MRVIKQLFWIFLFSLLGELAAVLLADFIALPGSVIGMILLFLALHFNFLELSAVDEVGTWLTDNMAIFFVPVGVGLMTNFDILADFWFELLIILFITSIFMMGFIGIIVQKITTYSNSPKAVHVNKEGEKYD